MATASQLPRPRRPAPGSARDAVRALRRGTDGVAAVEFALILPFLLLLYVGSAALINAVSASRDSVILAETLANLVSEQPPKLAMTDATMTDIFNAAPIVMAPYTVSNLRMTVSNVEFVANASSASGTGFDAKTRWTVSMSGGTLRPCGTNPVLSASENGTLPSASTMPKGVYAAGFVIVADISYVYTPNFGGFSFNFGTGRSAAPVLSYTINRTSYMRPRQTDNIRYQAGQSASICSIASPQTS